MVILDTNVVSEFMLESPSLAVLDWLDAQGDKDLYVTSVSEAEILAGIAFLPDGRRRRSLASAADRAFSVLFADRVLPFDRGAALEFAVVAAMRRSAGQYIDHADCQIAAIARSVASSVATRNVKDFTGCGVEVINPWTANSDL